MRDGGPVVVLVACVGLLPRIGVCAGDRGDGRVAGRDDAAEAGAMTSLQTSLAAAVVFSLCAWGAFALVIVWMLR